MFFLQLIKPGFDFSELNNTSISSFSLLFNISVSPINVPATTLPLFSVFQHPHSVCMSSSSESSTSTYSNENTSSSSSILSSNLKMVNKRTSNRTLSDPASMNNYIDKLPEENKKILPKPLVNFSLHVIFLLIASLIYQKMVRALQPSYVPHIPGHKKLSTTILDICHEECISSLRSANDYDSILLIDDNASFTK